VALCGSALAEPRHQDALADVLPQALTMRRKVMSSEVAGKTNVGDRSSTGGEELNRVIAEAYKSGRVPLKIVTGHQTTSNLNFDLKPGAIVAEEGATVIFVCG